jgi:hypothetical protein
MTSKYKSAKKREPNYYFFFLTGKKLRRLNMIGRVLVVFFCYLMNTPNVNRLILSYVSELYETRLFTPHVDFVVVLSGENFGLFEKIAKMIWRIHPRANITWSHGNEYEYPGIYTIWANSHSYHIVGYSHCRGLTHGKTTTDVVFRVVMKEWRKVFSIFHLNKKVNRIGFVGSTSGYGWYNFWWARAAHFYSSPKPAKGMERHYYERYLGLREGISFCPPKKSICYGNADDFFSLALNSMHSGWTIPQVIKLYASFDKKFPPNNHIFTINKRH